MTDKKYVIVEPETVEYVLAGYKTKMLSDGRGANCMADGKVGYLLSKDLKPTREVGDALTITLQCYGEYYHENHAQVCAAGMYLYLREKSKAERWLKDHPLPRKSIGKKTREQVYSMFDGRCAYCGRRISLEAMQVDHIVSHMSNGGEDTVDNYYPACQVCNRVKSALTMEQFRANVRDCARIHHKPGRRYLEADSDKIAEYYGLLGDDWKEKPIVFYFEKEKK